MQLTGPDGKPILGPDGKPATVSLSVDSSAAPSVPPDKVVIQVGTESVTAGELDRLIGFLPEQMRSSARGPGRRQFAENIVRLKLLAQEARKRKLDQSPAFQAQAAFQAENLLAGLVYQDISKSITVDEAAARAYYEQHKSDYERVHARHILVRMAGSPVPVKPGQKDLAEAEALAKAQELRKKIVDGADFAAIAKAESDDTGSGGNGGDLGFFGHGQMVPSFEQAAFAMKVGELSEPVRSQFGYHLIKLEGREAKSFDEERSSIEQRLRPEMAQKALEQMRESASVTIDPAYFGEAPKPQDPKPEVSKPQVRPDAAKPAAAPPAPAKPAAAKPAAKAPAAKTPAPKP